MTEIPTDEIVEAMAKAVCAKRRVVCIHLPCECIGWKAYAAEQRLALTAALAVLRKTQAVVPREETVDMLYAGAAATSKGASGIYRAMLAAAEGGHDAG